MSRNLRSTFKPCNRNVGLYYIRDYHLFYIFYLLAILNSQTIINYFFDLFAIEEHPNSVKDICGYHLFS